MCEHAICLCIQSFIQVHFKKLHIGENLKQSHDHCTAEMNKGIYPPSLKFNITYEDGLVDYTLKRKAHNVSLKGCDEGDEVTFGIVVFEPPASALGMCMLSIVITIGIKVRNAQKLYNNRLMCLERIFAACVIVFYAYINFANVYCTLCVHIIIRVHFKCFYINSTA